ncbi:TIM barrel protein [Agrobacterium vitis]|uniref:sugar phosphate isomerase/epimerase family protein n=1 Tax=Agrobacterium vitis TaxID=373 RepID=UPI0008728074|nr:TIM barrel protein [Agrobacterium vitis]MCE6076971.1 TIM barrel protein [Agrobacterium vitis]MUO71708.1 TIM barrel protein [Agrobacterium vitis]MUO86214.1 TIM barrel protein [Agrobacterium vitis]
MTHTVNMKDIPIGVAHFSAIQLPPSQFVTQAPAAGFNSVGLRLHPAFPGAPYYELPQGSKAASEFRALLDGEGMKVFDIEFFVIDPNFNAASVEHIVAAAADIGAKRLSACGDDGNYERLIGNLTEFCQLAALYGMAVDVENMGWRAVNTYSKSAALVEACGQDNAGVLVDAIHFFRNNGNIDEINTDIVRHVQLCDVVGPAPKRPEDMVNEARAGRLAPGDGMLGLHELLNKLAGRATISVEVPSVGDMDPVVHLTNLNLKARRILQSGS